MNDVNIGKAIEDRLKELRMTKSEFGKKIGMPQQNVNRILRNKYINTEKLVNISEVLHFNFFKLYNEDLGDINVVASGDSSIAAVNSDVKAYEQQVMEERLKYMEKILAEKERLIQFLMKDLEQKNMG